MFRRKTIPGVAGCSMKKSFVIGGLILLVGCSGNMTTGITEEDLEVARQEGYDEAYETAHEEGYDQGYEEGYEEGYEIGLSEIPEETDFSVSTGGLPGNDLSLASDGFDWNTKMDLDKRDFIQALATENNEFLTINDAKNVVSAIDVYYSNNSQLKTIGEVLEELN